MDNGDLVTVVVLGILEGVLADTSRGNFSDQLDTLDNTVDNFVFNTGVFTFLKDKIRFLFSDLLRMFHFSHRVFTNSDQVNIVVKCSVALQASAWSHVGVQVEFLSQGEIQRTMSLANWSHQRTFQTDLVSVDGVNCSLGNTETTIGISDWRDIDSLPFNGNSSNGEDFLNGCRNFRSDTIAGNQRDFACA